MDHCEDALTVSSLENFRLIADRKAGTLVQQVASLFKEIILATTEKRHKRRESMDEVCVQVGFSLEAMNGYMVHVNNVCCFCHRLSDDGTASSRVVVVVVL